MELDEILSRLDDELTPKPPHDPLPDLLFHYTDAAGFHGILANRAIRATDFRYLNDVQEIRIGERHFRDTAIELADAAVSERQRFILSRLVKHHDEASVSKVFPPCVASFSADGDLLSQWRAYAANGAGYSIGFTGFPLPTGPSAEAHVALWLIRCEYDVGRFKAAVRDELSTLAARYEDTAAQHAVDTTADGLIGGLFVTLGLRHAAALVPRLKHHKFCEEQEWRLMAFPRVGHKQSVLEYRPSARGLIPYLTLELAPPGELLRVSRVYVGPTQATEHGVVAARGFVESLGYDPAIVQPSEIPFRG